MGSSSEEVRLTPDSAQVQSPGSSGTSGFGRTVSTGAGALGAWRDGWRRVAAAPAIAAGVFVLTFALAAPLALTLRGMLQSHLGRSLIAAEAADGVSYDWWQEFSAQASGIGATFAPAIVGFAATLDNVSGLADGQGEILPIASALALYLVGWSFVGGGILDRYARQRRTRTHGFFAACGVHFFRFLRLAIAAGIFYWWMFDFVHYWLFDEWYPRLTRDISVERTVFAVRAALYLAFAALLLFGNLVFDYTRIRAVVEDRRSMLGAMNAALRFIAANPGSTLGLYALNGAVFAGVLLIWALVAPGAGGAGASIAIGFAIGQVYVLARLLLKLQFMASQTALFQSRLAHATYAAAPEPAWPDSPMAEAIHVSGRDRPDRPREAS